MSESPRSITRLDFRRGDEPIGNLELGRKFLSAHVHGTFLARDSDADTRERLLDAIGVDHLLDDLD